MVDNHFVICETKNQKSFDYARCHDIRQYIYSGVRRFFQMLKLNDFKNISVFSRFKK